MEMPLSAPTYPREREADVVLRDGSVVHVRPVRPDDGPAIRAFLERLSPESIVLRFFARPNLDSTTRWAVDVDYCDRFALVVEAGSPRTLIAHAAYVREGIDHAEVAFMVADAWQGRGISTILLARLAKIAHEHEIPKFTADVLPRNRPMIEVFRRSGLPMHTRSTPDAIAVEFSTSPAEEDRERLRHVVTAC